MANEVVIHIKGDAKEAEKAVEGLTEKLKAVSGDLKKVGAAMLGFGAALTAGLTLSVKAAAEEEAGIAKLSQALKNVGVSYDAVGKSLEANIEATQQKTAIADDQQRDALQKLIEVTGDYQRALALMPLTLDLAAAKGMDFGMAAEVVGRVAAGNVTILSRYGIQLKEGATATEALTALTQKFGGQAEAMGRTVSGQMKLLKANFGDASEALGATLLPTITKLTESLNRLVLWFKHLSPEMQNIIGISMAATAAIATLGGAFLLFLGFLPSLLAGFKALPIVLHTVGAAFHAALGPIGLITLGVAAVTAGVIYMVKNWDIVKPALQRAVNAMLGSIEWFANGATRGFNAVIRGINSFSSAISFGAIPAIKEIAEISLPRLEISAKKIADTGQQAAKGFADGFKQSAEEIKANLQKVIEQADKFGGQLTKAIRSRNERIEADEINSIQKRIDLQDGLNRRIGDALRDGLTVYKKNLSDKKDALRVAFEDEKDAFRVAFDDKKDALRVAFEDEKDAFRVAFDDKKDALRGALNDEMDALKKAFDDKKELYEKDTLARIGALNIQTAQQLKVYHDQISIIEAAGVAEEKAERQKENAARRVAITERLRVARGNLNAEEIKKIETELAAFDLATQEESNKRRRAEDRRDRIDAIRGVMDFIRERAAAEEKGIKDDLAARRKAAEEDEAARRKAAEAAFAANIKDIEALEVARRKAAEAAFVANIKAAEILEAARGKAAKADLDRQIRLKDDLLAEEEQLVAGRLRQLEEDTQNRKEELKKQLETVSAHFKTLNTEETLQAEARKLIIRGNNEEIITLLNSYNPQWQDAGQNFGQKLIEGLNSEKANIQKAVAEMLALVVQGKSAASSIGGGGGALPSGLSASQIDAIAQASWAASAVAAAGGARGVGFTEFQAGGLVLKPTLALLGEKGPEAVVPLRGATLAPTNITVSIVNRGIIGIEDLDAHIFQAIRDGKRRGAFQGVIP